MKPCSQRRAAGHFGADGGVEAAMDIRNSSQKGAAGQGGFWRGLMRNGLPMEFLFFGFIAGLWMLWVVLFRYLGWFYDAP